jgi:hypothetical protein
MLTSLPRAASNALRFKSLLGASWWDLLREGLSMKRSQDLSWSQVVMAANSPMLLKASMVDGNVESGVMAGGQVSGLIEDLPSCAELIDRRPTRFSRASRQRKGTDACPRLPSPRIPSPSRYAPRPR